MRKVLVVLLAIIVVVSVWTSYARTPAQVLKKKGEQAAERCYNGDFITCLRIGAIYYDLLHSKLSPKNREKFGHIIAVARQVCSGKRKLKDRKLTFSLCRILAGYKMRRFYLEINLHKGTKDKKVLQNLLHDEYSLFAYMNTTADRFNDTQLKKYFLKLCKSTKINPAIFENNLANSASCAKDERQVAQIIRDFLSTHEVSMRCNSEYINGVTTYNCGVIVVRCSEGANFTNNSCSVTSNYSTAVDTQVAKVLQSHGYNVSSQLNLASAFTSYVTKSLYDCYTNHFFTVHEKYFYQKLALTGAILADMINNADVIQFQKLVNLFVKNKIF